MATKQKITKKVTPSSVKIAKRAGNMARTVRNKLSRAAKHAKRHPNDTGAGTPKVETVTCVYCGLTLPASKALEWKVLREGKDIRHHVLSCGLCKRDHYDNTILASAPNLGTLSGLPSADKAYDGCDLKAERFIPAAMRNYGHHTRHMFNV